MSTLCFGTHGSKPSSQSRQTWTSKAPVSILFEVVTWARARALKPRELGGLQSLSHGFKALSLQRFLFER